MSLNSTEPKILETGKEKLVNLSLQEIDYQFDKFEFQFKTLALGLQDIVR